MASHPHHPLHAVHNEVEHLIEVAEKGESNATPALMLGGLALVLVPLVALVITVALATAYFATRDEGKARGAPPSGERAQPVQQHGIARARGVSGNAEGRRRRSGASP